MSRKATVVEAHNAASLAFPVCWGGVYDHSTSLSRSIDLIDKVIDTLEANGTDMQNNPSWTDSKISQKIRNLKSHGTLEDAGAVYEAATNSWTL